MPVVLSGVNRTLRALSLFNVNAAREVSSKVQAAVKPVVRKARGYAPVLAPLSGWGKPVGKWENKVYNSWTIRDGIGFSTKPTKPNKNGFSYTAYIFNNSIAGAIYETAGRKSPNGRKQAPLKRVYTNAGTPSAQYSGRMIRSGTKNQSLSDNPNAGKQFINALGKIYKAPRKTGQVGRLGRKQNGRLIFRAWGEDQGKVLGAVASAYSRVAKDFNAGRLFR